MKRPEDMSRDELEEEVAYLRDLIWATNDQEKLFALREALGLPAHAARFVIALRAANGRFVDVNRLDEMLPGTFRQSEFSKGYFKVMASLARRALGHESIKTVWGQGYALTKSAIAEVDAALAFKKGEAA